jgi:hypothetical protein
MSGGKGKVAGKGLENLMRLPFVWIAVLRPDAAEDVLVEIGQSQGVCPRLEGGEGGVLKPRVLRQKG